MKRFIAPILVIIAGATLVGCMVYYIGRAKDESMIPPLSKEQEDALKAESLRTTPPPTCTAESRLPEARITSSAKVPWHGCTPPVAEVAVLRDFSGASMETFAFSKENEIQWFVLERGKSTPFCSFPSGCGWRVGLIESGSKALMEVSDGRNFELQPDKCVEVPIWRNADSPSIKITATELPPGSVGILVGVKAVKRE